MPPVVISFFDIQYLKFTLNSTFFVNADCINTLQKTQKFITFQENIVPN